jgi:hypothetical protein
MTYIDDFKNDFYKNRLTKIELIHKYSEFGITEHIYNKLRKELNLSRPKTNKLQRIMIDCDIISSVKDKPINKIPEDMGNYVEITVENTPQKTRKAVAKKKIEEHVKRNAEKLHNNPDVDDILADYSGIDDIVKETEKSNARTEKIINKIKSKSKLKKK